MQKLFILVAAVLGAFGVGLGAFGAHALQDTLMRNQRLDTYQTAVLYHFIHTIALLLIGILLDKYFNNYLIWAGICMICGVVIFSGSLYVLSITNYAKLGMITPFGGLFFIAGWILLLIGSIKSM